MPSRSLLLILKLWLLPVACGAGGGAWVTSPSVWQRLRRSAALAGVLVPAVPCVPATSRACCPRTSPVLTQLQLAPGQDAWVVLGSLPLAHQPPADADAARAWSAWAAWVATTAFGADDSVWHDLVVERLVIVSDRVLDGLLPLSLVDRARNNVAETVNLWREE